MTLIFPKIVWTCPLRRSRIPLVYPNSDRPMYMYTNLARSERVKGLARETVELGETRARELANMNIRIEGAHKFDDLSLNCNKFDDHLSLE